MAGGAACWAKSRCGGGILFKLLVFLVVIAAFVALGWMLFLPVLLTQQLRKRTGFDATVERFSVNPVSGRVDLRGLVVTNPPTFQTSGFLEVREFKANADVVSLFSSEPVFDTMTLDLAHVTLVKREDGTTNAEAFEQNLNDASKRLRPVQPSRKFMIHRLDLKIDRLTIADHSLRRPSIKEFPLHLHQNYVDVTDLTQLLGPAVLKNLAPVATAVGGLIPGELGKALGDATKSGADLLKNAGRRTEDKVKGFFDALEESKKP